MTKNDGWGSDWPVQKVSLDTAKERLSKVDWPSGFDKAADEAMAKADGVPEQWIAEAGHDKTPWPINSNMAEEALKQDSSLTPEMLGVKPVNLDPDGSIAKMVNDAWLKAPELLTWDLGTGERTVLTKFNDNGDVTHTVISQTELKSQGSNLVDDQAYLYFQCEGCNEILDPHTKSFAKLQEARAKAGWKCVWNMNGQGYKVYCAKCGEKVDGRRRY